MTEKDKELIYERFRDKVYQDFTDFKDFISADFCTKEIVYQFAEEITFRESLGFWIFNGTYLEENVSAENCRLLNANFGNRILRTLYTYWTESDFTGFGLEELTKMMNVVCDRIKAEKHYFDYVKIDKCYSMSYVEAYKSVYAKDVEVADGAE